MVAVGHLWYNSGTNFAGSVSARTLRDQPSARTIRTFKSHALRLTPMAPFRELQVQAVAPLELPGSFRRILARSALWYTYCMHMQKMNTMNA
jgi:hypothetical protein